MERNMFPARIPTISSICKGVVRDFCIFLGLEQLSIDRLKDHSRFLECFEVSIILWFLTRCGSFLNKSLC